MKKYILIIGVISLLASCNNKQKDSRNLLADALIEYLSSKGFNCDTTFNDVTNTKTISLSQKELFFHYYPEQKDTYEAAVNEVRKTHNDMEGNGSVILHLNGYESTFGEKVNNLTDSLRDYIVSFMSVEPNSSFPNPEVYGYKWVYDNFQCEMSIHSLFSFCDGISIDIAMTNDRVDETDQIAYETTSQDPCIELIKRVYEDYVLEVDTETRTIKPFEQVVDDMFTKKGKQKLINAYEYELEPGEVGYALWTLRTEVQDYDDSGVADIYIKNITPLGNNKYEVKYYDSGWQGMSLVILAEEDGKMKIDDFFSDTEERH